MQSKTHSHGTSSPLGREFGDKLVSVWFPISNSGSLFYQLDSKEFEMIEATSGTGCHREIEGTYEFNGQWDYYQYIDRMLVAIRDSLSPKALFIPTRIFPNRP